jgi:hypothetical protein
MMRTGVSQSAVLVAGCVALVYASLAVIAASCVLSHIDPSNGHAHHGSKEAAPHNALCAWACQATSDAGLVPEPLTLSSTPVVRMMFLSPDLEIHSLSSYPLRSRAPPSVPFSLIA